MTDCNTSTLLFEEMKSGNTEIMRAVLKHCEKNKHAITCMKHAADTTHKLKYQKDYPKEALNY